MNNNSKKNTSKGKVYFTVVAVAAILMMAINTNANMNSSINAYASIFSNIKNADDIGQSLECVIVVVGCDGTGSVGSSGDVNVGSNFGSDDNNTNGNGNGNGNGPTACALCLDEALTDVQIDALAVLVGLSADATIEEICEALEGETLLSLTAILTMEPPGGLGLSVDAATALIDCLVDAGLTNLTPITP